MGIIVGVLLYQPWSSEGLRESYRLLNEEEKSSIAGCCIIESIVYRDFCIKSVESGEGGTLCRVAELHWAQWLSVTVF